MNRKNTLIKLIVFLFMSSLISAQIEKGNEYDALNINMTYGAHLPGGDLADRFGFHFSVGLGMDYILDPSNLIFGVEAHYKFGGIVHEDVIANLRTPEGEIIGNDLQYASVNLRQRGMYTGVVFGKLFNTHPTNRKEGIRAAFGVGYVWHKIRIQDDFDTAPQFSGDYIKGYDRLTDGLGIKQFIGYQKLARNRRANFIIGLEFMQAFTSSVREYNWDTREFATGGRIDFSFGIRVAWTLPFYVGQPSSTIYY